MGFLSSSNTSYNSYNIGQLSNTLTCSICGQSIATCSCQPAITVHNTYTSGGTNTFCTICGKSLGMCQCFTSVTTYTTNISYTWTCPTCGNPFGSCTCYSTGTGTVRITPSPNTTFTCPVTSDKIVTNFKVLSIDSKEEYDASGWFRIQNADKENGILGTLDLLYLPEEFKNAFYQLREETGSDIWQILTPILLRIDSEENGVKESHFYSIYGFNEIKWKNDFKKICITFVKLQEIVSTLELIRLNEIQRVFTKLLRRL